MNDDQGQNDDHGLIHLVQIYGEIDQRIKASPHLAARVSWLLPAYEEAYAESAHPDVHWFEDFEAWMRDLVRENGGDREFTFPGLEQSIDFLAELEPLGRMRARRLHVAGAAARILRNELSDEQLAVAALGAAAVEKMGGAEAAKEFVEILRTDPEGIETEAAPLEAWWNQMLSWGPLEAGNEVGPPPCSGGLVWVDLDGEPEPVATLETVFESALTFKEAEEFCDPLEWPCFPFWCDMKALGPKTGPLKPGDGVREFREIVSLDCPNVPTRLTVDLEFLRSPATGSPRVATTEYELAGEPPHPHIAVNEGTLEVVELPGGHVRVKSTKRLKFKGTFDGPAFASVMCLVGYLSYVEDLLSCAAKKKGEKGFPGQVPDKSPQDAGPDADPYFPGLTKYTIERVAKALEECLDEYSKAAKGPAGGPKQGSKAAGTPAQRMADTYSRMLHEGAKVAELGVRGAPTASGAGRRCGSGGARSPAGEVVEDWAQLGKLLVKKWSAHASQIATKLDAPKKYDADTMAADLATTASLAIETGARLTWETLDSATILCGGRGGPYIVDSDEFSIGVVGAKLDLEGDLKSGLGHTLPADAVLILVTKSTQEETRFKLRANATLCRAGTYRGTVRATPPGNVTPVDVRIVVP